MATIRELVSDKVQEIFYEYQKANNITSGDIEPFDAEYLDSLEQRLAQVIESICSKQPKAITFDHLTPSWYIYLDYEGTAHNVAYGEIDMDKFFYEVSKRIAHDDIYDETVVKIYYKGKEVFYVGWQPCMKFEYKDLGGNTIWVGTFPDWDH